MQCWIYGLSFVVNPVACSRRDVVYIHVCTLIPLCHTKSRFICRMSHITVHHLLYILKPLADPLAHYDSLEFTIRWSACTYIFILIHISNPYQSEKFAASLPQTCRKLAAHYLVRQRNLETVCRSVRLVAHFSHTTDCAPQRARLCARTRIVCEKCATIYS